MLNLFFLSTLGRLELGIFYLIDLLLFITYVVIIDFSSFVGFVTRLVILYNMACYI